MGIHRGEAVTILLESSFRLRSEQTAGQQCRDPVWQIGGRGIRTEDINLIGLIHVCEGIWNPILQLSANRVHRRTVAR